MRTAARTCAAPPERTQPSILDFNHDDYFEHGNAGCLDLANSAFIEPPASGAWIPPRW